MIRVAFFVKTPPRAFKKVLNQIYSSATMQTFTEIEEEPLKDSLCPVYFTF